MRTRPFPGPNANGGKPAEPPVTAAYSEVGRPAAVSQ